MTVYVVTGPPAAGKSTWVRDRARPGEPPHIVATVQAARAAAINDAAMDGDAWGEPSKYNVYIVHAMPDRHSLNRYRKYGFEIVTINPGHGECMRRAINDGRTQRQLEVITDWYQRRGLLV